MRVTIAMVTDQPLDVYSIEAMAREFPSRLLAERFIERMPRRQAQQHNLVFNELQAWAWLDKSRHDVINEFRHAIETNREYLPSEVWIVSTYGAVRRYAPTRKGNAE